MALHLEAAQVRMGHPTVMAVSRFVPYGCYSQVSFQLGACSDPSSGTCVPVIPQDPHSITSATDS